MVWFAGIVGRDSHRRGKDAQIAAGIDATERVSGPRRVPASAVDRETAGPERATPVRISFGRAGRYAITDTAGNRIGTMYGDYVIGFTVSCWDKHWTFSDLDQAKFALYLEAEARGKVALRAAS